MKISLSWLKELIDFDLTPKQLAEKLSLRSIGVKQVTDDYIELDLTYNRGDLLSLRGVAREVATIANSKVNFEEITPKYDLPKLQVKVDNEKLCPLYVIAKIENLKVEQSPAAWVKKLSDCGIRTVNNIADVTNLVMLEFGQPMHAFDVAKVREETLVVRVAKTGEKLTTLDGKVRNLDKEDLLIADTQKPLGLAGVMGGKDSEVSPSTTTILLEAAIFDPVTIRRTSKRYGLYSEASKRFQHGLTKTNLLQALVAAIKIYESLGGELTALSLEGDLQEKPKTIQLTQQKINSLLGVGISADVVESSLQSLGFHLREDRTNWEVTVPFWRLDVNIEEDLIEEVARMYGYDKINPLPLSEEKCEDLDQTLPQYIYNLKVKLKEIGLTEVQTYSFYSTAVLEALGINKTNLVKIANPISSETEYLRDQLWPNLVEVVGKNLRKGYKDIGLFEIGKIYCKDEDNNLKEADRLSIALMNNTDNPLEELYQLVQSLSLHLPGVELNHQELFHPNRFLAGGLAEVHLRVLNKLGIEKRVAVMEIELEKLLTSPQNTQI